MLNPVRETTEKVVKQAKNVRINMGELRKAAELAEKIVKMVLIPAGSRDEVEIRSATVWAVEYLAQALNERGVKILPFQVDWLPWNKCQEVHMEEPYHLTETIFY